MPGARPLSADEVKEVKDSFGGMYALRDRALFVTGLRTGFRISELLSLRVRDVRPYRKVSDKVSVQRRHMKKKTAGRAVVLHPEAKEALALWLAALEHLAPEFGPDTMLFLSRKGQNQAITRQHASRILKQVYDAVELEGPLGTHAMRKTFAARVHELLGRDLVKTQKALGHMSVTSTISYLQVDEKEIDAAVLAQ